MNKLEDKIKALSSALPMSLILILSRWKMQKVLCSLKKHSVRTNNSACYIHLAL